MVCLDQDVKFRSPRSIRTTSLFEQSILAIDDFLYYFKILKELVANYKSIWNFFAKVQIQWAQAQAQPNFSFSENPISPLLPLLSPHAAYTDAASAPLTSQSPSLLAFSDAHRSSATCCRLSHQRRPRSPAVISRTLARSCLSETVVASFRNHLR